MHRFNPLSSAATAVVARHPPALRSEHGALAVELALVIGLCLTLLLGTVDLARWALATAALHEAAREGARTAVVCDLQDPAVLQRALSRLQGLRSLATNPVAAVDAEPSGCSVATCTRIRLTLQGAALTPVNPIWPGALPLPDVVLELPRESLRSTLDSRSNPQCQFNP